MVQPHGITPLGGAQTAPYSNTNGSPSANSTLTKGARAVSMTLQPPSTPATASIQIDLFITLPDTISTDTNHRPQYRLTAKPSKSPAAQLMRISGMPRM